jgi:hypothetical protein
MVAILAWESKAYGARWWRQNLDEQSLNRKEIVYAGEKSKY